MNKLSILVLAILGFALVGCKEVEIQNGEVPESYMYLAKKLGGTYAGSFDGIRGDLVIKFDGNRPILEFINPQGKEILGADCDSEIGLLQTVYLKGRKESPKISSAVFELDPGRCRFQIQGRQLTLEFDDSHQKIRAAILKRRYEEQRCKWEFVNPSGSPQHVCKYETVYDYLSGRFNKR